MPTGQRQTAAQATFSRPNSKSLRKPSLRTQVTHVLQRVEAAPASLTAADVLTLQRAIGNRATGQLLQTKLKLGPAGDRYEQEADRVAKQVVQASHKPAPQHEEGGEETIQASRYADSIAEYQRSATPVASRISRVQRTFVAQRQMPGVQRDEIEDELQASPNHGLKGGEVDTAVAQSIQRAKGRGQPLDEGVRGQMEKGFGASFGGVRVHTDAQADALNRSLNAKAFTTGNDIFFGKGAYQPGSSSGQELIAHELTHTVQQGASQVQAQREDDGTPSTAEPAAADSLNAGEEAIQRRIGFELETGLPVMYEKQEDVLFDGFSNDELEAPFPGGKLMVDHLPGHEPTASEPFEEWNIIEFVTDPIADDLSDNTFRGMAETWIDNLQQLRDYARNNFDYIQNAPNVGAPQYEDTVIGRPAAERGAYPAARWERIGPQATMGVKLSNVSTAFANTDFGNSWEGTTKHSRVSEGAHKAGPAANSIITSLLRSFPPTQGRDEGVEPLRGLITLIMNYLLSGKATGTAGYIKNRSTFMYKSKLSSVRNQINNDYYAGKILSRYPKRRRKLSEMLLKKAGLKRNDEVYKGATFPSDSRNLVRAGVWVDEVLAGTEDRLFEAMKNPWSNELAPEDIHGEMGAVMEMRDFKENQIDMSTLPLLSNPDNVVNILLEVYKLNRQWATG